MEQGKIVYQNNGFIITEHPRVREYFNSEINDNDKIYRIKLLYNTNQPTIQDVGKLVYYLLKNKILENKFQEYKEIILDEINTAEYERHYPKDRNQP